MADLLNCRLADWLIGKLADWLADSLAGEFADWMVNQNPLDDGMSRKNMELLAEMLRMSGRGV